MSGASKRAASTSSRNDSSSVFSCRLCCCATSAAASIAAGVRTRTNSRDTAKSMAVAPNAIQVPVPTVHLGLVTGVAY
jgi:hypothetical protein